MKQAVSDDTFWNSVRAKADEILESAAIYVANRIERDARTLAAVGLFTLDRIRRDVGRALPAATRQARKLLLATNSTYAERLVEMTFERNRNDAGFQLPTERSVTDREILQDSADLYDDLTTPADEIRSVTSAILDILSGKELDLNENGGRRRVGVVGRVGG